MHVTYPDTQSEKSQGTGEALVLLYHTGYSPKAVRHTKYTFRILENTLFKLTFLSLQYW